MTSQIPFYVLDDSRLFSTALVAVLKRLGFNAQICSADELSTARTGVALSRKEQRTTERHFPLLCASFENSLTSTRGSLQLPIQDWDSAVAFLQNVLRQVVEKQRLLAIKREVQELERSPVDRFGEIKGHSEKMHRVIRQLERVSPLRIPILIVGESGVGKELIARAIHRRSEQSNGPLVAVNCAAIQPELFEAELFGHARGAFTGAISDRLGLCGAANEGTLFLDEVGELPLALQAKLLRLLEQREYRPVGSSETLSFTGRFVSATNVALREAVREKRFRQDLYFRLSPHECLIPPLRERPEDISILAYHFVERFSEEFSLPVRGISDAAMRKLLAHTWAENNVRELQRCIQRAIIASEGDELRPEDIELSGAQMPGQLDSSSSDWGTLSYSEASALNRRNFLRSYLQHQLDECGGNNSKAAARCGIKAPNFHRLLKECGLK